MNDNDNKLIVMKDKCNNQQHNVGYWVKSKCIVNTFFNCKGEDILRYASFNRSIKYCFCDRNK